MTVCNSDILSITQSVLETMLDMGVREGPVAEPRSEVEHMTGCVQISGTWQGAVVIQTTENFVTLASCKMLGIAESEVTAADLEDTLAEITNIIGGNIKSQVPSPSFLSIPSVTRGVDFSFRLTKAEIVSKMPMNSNNQPLIVLICEARD